MTDPADSIKLSVVPVWFKVCEGPCSALCCVPQGLLVGISGYSKQTAVQAPLCTLRLSAEVRSWPLIEMLELGLGTRSGYLFRHGKHGLGYYRADKLSSAEQISGVERAFDNPDVWDRK
ncbi:hypothetical protein WJX84_009951 [Apatococcus fuscideae]|uniref:Uncharacterized protein n=1 Tax=Apatococcus fuscideae TaxID=2026836 RepID=A0AAW1TDR5_9CHLO